jgi:hypothetical protein
MTEITTFAHEARGFFRCEDGISFFAEFIVHGVRKPFSGRFDHRVIPFDIPMAILRYDHLDELYADFRIDVNSHPIVGPSSIRLPLIKREILKTTRFFIDGPLARILSEGCIVGGGGSWLLR